MEVTYIRTHTHICICVGFDATITHTMPTTATKIMYITVDSSAQCVCILLNAARPDALADIACLFVFVFIVVVIIIF